MKLNKFFITCSILLVTGCYHSNQPIASIDLVEADSSKAYKFVNSELNVLLNQNPEKFNSFVNSEQITLYPIFFSAIGDKCRYVTQQGSKKLYCRDELNRWRTISSVFAEPLSSASESSL